MGGTALDDMATHAGSKTNAMVAMVVGECTVERLWTPMEQGTRPVFIVWGEPQGDRAWHVTTLPKVVATFQKTVAPQLV